MIERANCSVASSARSCPQAAIGLGDSHEAKKLPSKTLGQLGAPAGFAQQQPKSDWLCPASLGLSLLQLHCYC